MKVVNQVALTFVAMLFSVGAFAQIKGVWLNQDKTAHIEIYEGIGGKLFGKIVFLQEPNENGKPKTDPMNPNLALRERARLGMVILSGLVANGKDYWDKGNIYNPKDGKSYSLQVKIQADGTLNLRGYVGVSLLGKTQIWTRLK